MEKERKEKMQESQNALLHLILKSQICGLKCVVRRQSARIGFSTLATYDTSQVQLAGVPGGFS